MRRNSVKIALVQQRMSEQLSTNKERALQLLSESARSEAQLVCFPELQLSPFFPQYPSRDVSHYVVRPGDGVVEKLAATSGQLGIVTVTNLYLELDGHRYDASPVIDADGSLLGISKMVHVVQTPCFYEQDYYTPSDGGFEVYDTAAGRIGVVICFDRHYPESIRTCALQGAQLIVIPTANTVAEPLETFAWELRVAAMQNGVFIAMCNRVGIEGEMQFAGESLVIGPDGQLLCKAGNNDEILYAELDLSAIKLARQQRPFLDLSRPEKYWPQQQRCLALTIRVVPGTFSVCRLDAAAELPLWSTGGQWMSITRTPDELSIVCAAEQVPPEVSCETDWALLEVAGPLDFCLTGILAGLSTALANGNVSTFALSTYDTDYLLVKQDKLERAKLLLHDAGCRVE